MQLKQEQRIKIDVYLREGKTITEISEILGYSYQTILREINNRSILVYNSKVIKHIKIKEEHICTLLEKQPKVCNKCPKFKRNTCCYDYIVYDSNVAQDSYDKRKKRGIGVKQELYLDLVKKCLKKQQPISHIISMIKRNYNDTLTRQTIYDWYNKGFIEYNKKNVRRKNKIFKDKETYQIISKKERLKGREYFDFLEYVKENKNTFVTEIDLVEGIKSSDIYLLTIFIPEIQFLFAFRIKNKYPTSVAKVFDWIEKRIGHKNFKRLFEVLLTDQGSEFLNHEIITKSIYDSYTKRCKIFYCEAGKPHQKSHVENIHRLLRRYIPKRVDLSNYSQDDINFIVSNINSMYKSKYKNKSPIELFKERFSKIILDKLSIEEIACEDIIVTSYHKISKI